MTKPVVFVHEWSKAQDLLRCFQVWSWGQPWKFIVMESNLLLENNPIFEGTTQNNPHFSNHILILGDWCDVLFYVLLCLIWVLTKLINLFPTFNTVICRVFSFFVMQELLLLFLWRVIYAILYIVIGKNSFRYYFLLECKLNSVNIIMSLELIIKTAREHV